MSRRTHGFAGFPTRVVADFAARAYRGHGKGAFFGSGYTLDAPYPRDSAWRWIHGERPPRSLSARGG